MVPRSAPERHLDRFSRFARLAGVPNANRDTQTTNVQRRHTGTGRVRSMRAVSPNNGTLPQCRVSEKGHVLRYDTIRDAILTCARKPT